MKTNTLLVLIICSVIASGFGRPILAQQNPPPDPAAAKRAADAKAAQEKRNAEREAAKAKRAAETNTRVAKHKGEMEAAKAKRAAEKEVRVARQKAQKDAAVAKRAASARKPGPPDGTFKFLSSRMSSDFTKIVKGAPYSALATSEYIQRLADGNQIIRRNEAVYYRDSDGRIRVEQQLKSIGKWSVAGEPARIILIGDPVSGEYFNLDPSTRTAVRNVGLSERMARQKEKLEREAERAASRKLKPEDPRSVKVNAPSGPAKPLAPKESSDGRRKTESLGRQKIEGVDADGKRTTETIPAGEIGNTLPIEIVNESWYSAELQTLVMSRHHDPRSGDTVYRLTKINRREPERALFAVPGDYRIVDKNDPRTIPTKSSPPKNKD